MVHVVNQLFFDTIDNTIILVDEASEIVNEKSFDEVARSIKDGIAKLLNKFIETIKGLWQKFIDSITKFFEEHNLGTLIGGHLEKSLDNIPVPQDIYKLVNTDFSKLLLDANKVIGDESFIGKLSSASDKISDDINGLYTKLSAHVDENDLNADINTCNNHVNKFKDYVSKYSASFAKNYTIYLMQSLMILLILRKQVK